MQPVGHLPVESLHTEVGVSMSLGGQVGVKDLVLKGRLRTTFIPLLYAMPIVGAVQVSSAWSA